MKFSAPPHTHDVHLSTGPVVVDADGTVTVPDDLSQGDVVALCSAGFTPLPPQAAATAGEPKAKAAKEG